MHQKDKNIPFWDFDAYFGDSESVLNMTDEQKRYIIIKYGENALAQSILKAKVILIAFKSTF